jgi:hypothetical protein
MAVIFAANIKRDNGTALPGRVDTRRSLALSFSPSLSVLGFGLLVDEKIVIGILASRQELFIELALGGLAARKPLSPGHLQSC